MLHGNESTSEHFFDAEDSFASSDLSSIRHEQPAPPDPPAHTPAVTTATAVSTPRNSMPDKARGLRLMLLTELGGR
ncbi:hypothetical protein ABQE91_21170, partial [Xanthomonas campestris pv. campestris]